MTINETMLNYTDSAISAAAGQQELGCQASASDSIVTNAAAAALQSCIQSSQTKAAETNQEISHSAMSITRPPLTSGATYDNLHKEKVYGEEGNQTHFNTWFANTVTETAKLMNPHSRKPMLPLLETIGKKRRDIAQTLKHLDADKFGKLRPYWDPKSRDADRSDTTLITDLYTDGRYQQYHKKCAASNNADDARIRIRVILPKSTPIGSGEARVQPPGILPVQTPITLSCCLIYTNNTRVYHGNVSEQESVRIFQYLDQTMQKILQDATISKEDLLQSLGTIHWWLAHMTPFTRGSAVISEILIQAIATIKGYPSSYWKHNTMPDLEAIISKHDEFVNQYKELLLLD